MKIFLEFKHKLLANLIIKFMNELLELDRVTISKLIDTRIICNELLANHPTVQVNSEHEVGLLGILNGLVGIKDNGYGYITAVFDDDNNIVRFEKTK